MRKFLVGVGLAITIVITVVALADPKPPVMLADPKPPVMLADEVTAI